MNTDVGRPVDADAWRQIIARAELGQPPIERTLLRSARNALARGRFRVAVVDAGTALEAALYQILDPPKRAKADNEQWTLGTIYREVRDSRKLPPTVTYGLVTLRNDVVHRSAKEPNESDARIIIDATQAAVESLNGEGNGRITDRL